jgi:hypothetical protein
MPKSPLVGKPLGFQQEPDAVLRKAKWAAMKEEFLELSITAQKVHWPTLAGKYGIPPQTARNKASTEKWHQEIENRRKAREEILEQKMVERTTMALDQLQQDFATNEAAIRKRHATMARGLQVRAIQRLKDIDLKDLTARDALLMLKLGIEEERFALGMAQLYQPAKDSTKNSDYTPIVEQLGGHQKVQRIGMLLLEALKGSDIDDIPDNASVGTPGEPTAPVESVQLTAAPNVVIKKATP